MPKSRTRSRSRSASRRKLSTYNKFVQEFSKTYRGPAKSRMKAAAKAWRDSGKSKSGSKSRKSKKSRKSRASRKTRSRKMSGGGSRRRSRKRTSSRKKSNSSRKKSNKRRRSRTRTRSRSKKLNPAVVRYKDLLNQIQKGKKFDAKQDKELRLKAIAMLQKH